MMTEAKVGLLFFIGLGVTLGFTLFVSDIGTSAGDLVVHFERVQGLGPGDSVLYNGIKVGTITAVLPEFVDEQPVVAVQFTLRGEVRERVVINEDTVVTIDSGMLGDAALSLRTTGPGRPIDNAGLEALHGVPPATLSQVADAIDQVVSENRIDLREAIAALPDAVSRFSDMAEEIRATVAENRKGIARTIDRLGDMGESVAKMAEENREEITRAVTNLADMGAEIQETVAENRPQLKAAIDRLPQTVETIDQAADEIRRAVADNRERIDTIMGSLSRLGPRLETIGEDVGQVTAQVASGRGTLGKLVFDEGLHDQVSAVLTSAEQRLDEIKPVTGGLSGVQFYIGVSSGFNAERENFTSTVYLRIEPKPWKFYEGGATFRSAPKDRDALDEEPDDLNIDLNLMLGWRFLPDELNESYRLALRVGLIEGQLGGHLNYTVLPQRLWLGLMLRDRHDGWNPLDRRYEEGEGVYGRALLEARVWNRVFIHAGADDLFDGDHTAFYVGLRAEILDMDIRNVVAAQSLLP